MIILAESLSFQEQALQGSMFSDYGTMLIMRLIGAAVIALILSFAVIYPLNILLAKRAMYRMDISARYNPMAGLRKEARRQKDYEKYLRWAARHGYEPIIGEDL